MGMYWSYNWI